MQANIAIALKKDALDRVLKKASKEAKNFIGKAEKYAHKDAVVLYWPFETLPVCGDVPTVEITRLLGKEEYDHIVVDEDGEIAVNYTDLDILGTKNVITWCGKDEDAREANGKDFLAKVRKLGLNLSAADAKRILEIAREVYE